jgi:orotate phosphoribosyltransferase
MTGGALLAELIADRLNLRFGFAERSLVDGRSCYTIPAALREVVASRRVAVVDDAISAGSAVGGTVAQVVASSGHLVALGALILVGNRPHQLAASLRMPLERLVDVSTKLWAPAGCPQCRRGEPLSEP